MTQLPKTSKPAGRALAAIGVDSLEALAGRKELEIAALHGMGPKGVRILKAAMAEKGLRFATSPASEAPRREGDRA